MDAFKTHLKQRFDQILAASDDKTINNLWKTSWKDTNQAVEAQGLAAPITNRDAFLRIGHGLLSSVYADNFVGRLRLEGLLRGHVNELEVFIQVNHVQPQAGTVGSLPVEEFEKRLENKFGKMVGDKVAELISGSEGEPLVEVITSNPYFDDKVDGSVERVARKRKLDLKALRRAPSQIRKLADHVGMEIDLEDDDDDEEEEQEGEHITYTFDATEDDLGPSAS